MMTLNKTLLLLAPLLASGCMLTPVDQAPRWTDTALEQQPAPEAPDYVPTLILDPATRQTLSDQQNAALAQGAEVRDQGDALRAPDPESTAYAAEQRARATPPQ